MPRIPQKDATPAPLVPFWQTSDGNSVRLYSGRLEDVLPRLPPESFDSVVTDPPYDLTNRTPDVMRCTSCQRVLGGRDGKPDSCPKCGGELSRQRSVQGKGFMGKAWDSTGIAFQPETWRKVLRTVKPGGYMLAFGGTRTYHRMVCAIEDAGWEIRDCLMWLYGTGFPKGQGCLKPSYEPVVLARKPGKRVLPLGIDGCRIPTDENPSGKRRKSANVSECGVIDGNRWVDRRSVETFQKERAGEANGRYPANVLHDGSDEVMEEFEKYGEKGGGFGVRGRGGSVYANGNGFANDLKEVGQEVGYGDSGSIARFYYCCKASKAERGEAREHPTVKPLELMKWCVRLVTPKGGRVLDCFAGSSMTGVAAMAEGVECVLIEKELPYVEAGKRKLEKVEKLLLPQKRVNVLEKKKHQ